MRLRSRQVSVFLRMPMGLELIPQKLRKRFLFDERHHATSVLAIDYAGEFKDIIECLGQFSLRRSDILKAGGGLSPIPKAIDGFLRARSWSEKKFDIKITIDDKPLPIPTHKIDNFRNRIGVETEWNNKTEFY